MKVSGNDSRTQTPFNTNHKHRSFIRRVVEVSLHQRFLSTWLRLVLLLCLLAIHQVDQVVGIDMAAENGECLNGDPTNHGDTDDLQYLFIIRHGDRWDYSNEDWKTLKTSRTGDSPLSPLGHRQAAEVGVFLDSWLSEKGFTSDDITWLSSPFLRCIETSNDALNAMTKVNVDKLSIKPEHSVFEWDGNQGEWHLDLPPLEERKHYFPRLDLSYQSLFIPTLPEPRAQFMERCNRAMNLFHERHPFRPRQVFIIVSHAAGCVALAKVLSKKNLNDITPAGPCSIYGFTRKSSSGPVWHLDLHDNLDGFNGYTGHLSDQGSTTVPWNDFGDGKTKFYTGPPTSRFAPKSP